ncbi:unnamed protein product [Mycena citricolor]|uniref:Uncharacterized protein n=1 Tax=Mycena citricolor TaxID=2018698 RepID=A0AAD2HZN8_9AGAR|nr:unnamed protein product [Mycena citricolor]
MTNTSLAATTAMTSTPFAFSSSYFSMYSGRWLTWQVGLDSQQTRLARKRGQLSSPSTRQFTYGIRKQTRTGLASSGAYGM